MPALLGMFASPVVKGALLLVLFFVWTAYQRYDAAADARAATWVKAQQQVAERTNAEIARQQEVSEKALRAAEKKVTALEAAKTELEGRMNATIANLRAAPEKACPISDDLMRQLLGIR